MKNQTIQPGVPKKREMIKLENLTRDQKDLLRRYIKLKEFDNFKVHCLHVLHMLPKEIDNLLKEMRK